HSGHYDPCHSTVHQSGRRRAERRAESQDPAPMSPLLTVEGLSVEFGVSRGTVRAVEDLSFTLRARETLAIVGESGSGKTTAALALLRLLPPGSGRITSGRIAFEGKDLVKLQDRELRRLRGARIA